jgi:hypothetical protein
MQAQVRIAVTSTTGARFVALAMSAMLAGLWLAKAACSAPRFARSIWPAAPSQGGRSAGSVHAFGCLDGHAIHTKGASLADNQSHRCRARQAATDGLV